MPFAMIPPPIHAPKVHRPYRPRIGGGMIKPKLSKRTKIQKLLKYSTRSVVCQIVLIKTEKGGNKEAESSEGTEDTAITQFNGWPYAIDARWGAMG